MKNKQIDMAIGQEMRKARTLKGLSLKTVATRMGIASKNTISRWELGEKSITISDLQHYCDVVDCDMYEILKNAV